MYITKDDVYWYPDFEVKNLVECDSGYFSKGIDNKESNWDIRYISYNTVQQTGFSEDWTFINTSQNVVVDLVGLLLRIREVLGTYLGAEIGYTDWGFSWFSWVSPGKFRDSRLTLN
jgi:hypothetical protein